MSLAIPKRLVDQRVIDRARIACQTPETFGHSYVGEPLVRYLQEEITAEEAIETLDLNYPMPAENAD